MVIFELLLRVLLVNDFAILPLSDRVQTQINSAQYGICKTYIRTVGMSVKQKLTVHVC